MKSYRMIVTSCVLFFCIAAAVQGQVPQLINFQGQLTDAGGNPANGTFTMIFAIFETASGGTALWSETQSVTVTNGIFNVLLGSVTPIPLDLFDSSIERYLEITVNGTVLTPRQRFGSVPYAFRARGGGGESGIQEIIGGNGIQVTDPTGPTATVSVKNNSIGTSELKEAATFGPNGTVGIASKTELDIVGALLVSPDDSGNLVLFSGSRKQAVLLEGGSDGGSMEIIDGDGSRITVDGDSLSILNDDLVEVVEARVRPSTGDGILSVNASDGSEAAAISSVADGRGLMRVNFADGGLAALMSTAVNGTTGALATFADNGNELITLISSPSKSGFLRINAADGHRLINMTGSDNESGFVNVNFADGSDAASMATTVSGTSGFMGINFANGSEAVRTTTTVSGTAGALVTFAANGKELVRITDKIGDGAGYVRINDKDGAERVTLSVDANNGGEVLTRTVNGTDAVHISTFGSGSQQSGSISVMNPAGKDLINLFTDVSGGTLFLKHSEAKSSIALVVSPNGGIMDLANADGNLVISLDGATGVVTATDFIKTGTSNSRTEHPLDPSKEIYTSSLEGPEAGLYTRGTAQLVNGEARIQLPYHFPLVATQEGLTVHLTPLSAASEGLAVVSKSTRAIVIKELRNGTGNYQFDYIVHAVRKGYENFAVIRDKVAPAAIDAVGALPVISEARANRPASAANSAAPAAAAKSIALPNEFSQSEKNK